MKYLYCLITFSVLNFSSSSINAQWIRIIGPSGSIYSLVSSGINLFAGNNNGKIFRSTNSGSDWSIVYSGAARTDALAISDTNLFAANDFGVLHSTNNGTSWSMAGLTNVGPQALAISLNRKGGINLFAGTFKSGVFLSTNLGATWTPVNSGLTGDALKITALFVSDTNLFAGTWGGGIYRSNNSGTSWIEAKKGLTTYNVHTFSTSTDPAGGVNLFAGTYFGNAVYLSTDNGGNWKTVNNGLTSTKIRALAHSDSNLFAGTDGDGVFLSTNNGGNWTEVNTGLNEFEVNALIFSGGYLYAGTKDGVWRLSMSEITTGFEDQRNGNPNLSALEQNYPNPFNPVTTIKYSITSPEFVALKVYDIVGREVAVLVNETKSAGNYKVEYKPENLSSGIYFYTLKTGKYLQTKKLILLK